MKRSKSKNRKFSHRGIHIMKRYVLFLIFFVISNNYIFSQLNIGVHGGLTIGNGKYQTTNLLSSTYKQLEDSKTKTGNAFSFGGLIEARLYSSLYLQAEIDILNHKTYLLSPPYNVVPLLSGQNYINLSCQYIEFPLLLKMKFYYNKFLPYCFVGVGIRVLNNATEGFDSFDGYHEYSITEFVKHEHTFLTMGIGVDSLLSDVFSIFATVSYSNSLVDIAKFNDLRYDTYFKPRNYDFLLGIKTNIFSY